MCRKGSIITRHLWKMQPQGIYFHCSMWRFCHMTFVNLFRNPTAKSQGTLSQCIPAFPKLADRKPEFVLGADFAALERRLPWEVMLQIRSSGTKHGPFALSQLRRWWHCIAFALLHNMEKALSWSGREGEQNWLHRVRKGSTPMAVMAEVLF